jgi:hypothetical protein
MVWGQASGACSLFLTGINPDLLAARSTLSHEEQAARTKKKDDDQGYSKRDPNLK